jgi:hypothetical protein
MKSLRSITPRHAQTLWRDRLPCRVALLAQNWRMRKILVAAIICVAGCGGPDDRCTLTVNGEAKPYQCAVAMPSRNGPADYELLQTAADGSTFQVSLPSPGKFDCASGKVTVSSINVENIVLEAGCGDSCAQIVGSCSIDISAITRDGWRGTVSAHLVSQIPPQTSDVVLSR